VSVFHNRKKRKHEESLDIPVTPMLDMAFQLLTFFVLTYRATPTEGQYSMNLLPAAPATEMKAKDQSDSAPTDDSIPASLKTLPTTLRAGEGGALGRVSLGEQDVQGMDALKKELKTILEDPSLPFDQTLIKVDPNLRYSELMQVIDVFMSLNLTKISFAELGAGDNG